MARGKVQLKTMQNPVSRRIIFSKRKAGLLRKAGELSLLCDAEVGLLIFSPVGKLYEFGSLSMNKIIRNYQKFSASTKHHIPLSETIEAGSWLRISWDFDHIPASCWEHRKRRWKMTIMTMLHLEVENLRTRMINLEKIHMIGEDLDSLSFKELKHLEKKINLGGTKLRLRKDKISSEYIESLKSKEQSLEAEKANLGKKICRSQKPGDINIGIMEGEKDKLGTDSATQQYLLQTNLSLT